MSVIASMAFQSAAAETIGDLRKQRNEMAEELAAICELLGIDGKTETILDVLRAHPDWQS